MFQKTINPKTVRQILPAVYAGLLASLCWIAGDILILGFTPNPAKYPLLSETYAFQINVDIATLMLSGSTSRLMWGALLAVFSMPLYLYGIFAVSRLIKRKFMMPVFLLLFIGRSLSPLGHAAFFYVGEIYKTILDTDPSAHARLLETALAFEKILKIVWTASVSFTTLGWLLFGVWVVQEKTVDVTALTDERLDRVCRIQRGKSHFFRNPIIHCTKETKSNKWEIIVKLLY